MFSEAWSEKSLSRVRLFATPWTEFSRPEYWSVFPFSSPGDLPNPGIKPRSSALQADSLPAESQGKIWSGRYYFSTYNRTPWQLVANENVYNPQTERKHSLEEQNLSCFSRAVITLTFAKCSKVDYKKLDTSTK